MPSKYLPQRKAVTRSVTRSVKAVTECAYRPRHQQETGRSVICLLPIFKNRLTYRPQNTLKKGQNSPIVTAVTDVTALRNYTLHGKINRARGVLRMGRDRARAVKYIRGIYFQKSGNIGNTVTAVAGGA